VNDGLLARVFSIFFAGLVEVCWWGFGGFDGGFDGRFGSGAVWFFIEDLEGAGMDLP
jgi:hypothetical protein